MKLAAYKGPAMSPRQQLVHRLTCALDSVRQSARRRALAWVRYSHCELVIGGVCFSSSSRDGGVRAKRIDLDSGRWDVFEIAGDEAAALAWFRRHDGENYDWIALLRFFRPLRWLPRRLRHWICSEACAAALGLLQPDTFSPYDLTQRFAPRR